ncbi:hypothetical protein BKG92_05440 [Rodentibacter ratti]|uniref:Uncharacterized protein n=1 Tax=Rodentibacter ratti TaxID=1906745 RepID=A0A1V3KZR7_9PAST|nr:hypothetical protein [Rodentibacter ratti]OOF82820.1 hypothetical protein BKG92_05440 [Rodentibacter ratti]
MLSEKEIQFLIKRHENKITLGNLLELYKTKYPNVSYIRLAKELYKDLRIKYEPDYKKIDGVFMQNPDSHKDYGFNSYFIPSGKDFLTTGFYKDNGKLVATALNFLMHEIDDSTIAAIEHSLNCNANDYLGAFSDIFLDVNQLNDKYNISVLNGYEIQEENQIFIKPSEEITRKELVIEDLQTKITELEKQLQAQQSAVNFQEVLPVSNLDENYNPTERETHLLMIDAMAKLLTNQNFNVNKYIRGKNINKKQISEDVTEHITKVLNTPETKPRSLETIRKRLDEALKLNEQAD